MKPVHECLAIARQFLFHPETNPHGVRRICGALEAAEEQDLLTFDEADEACNAVCKRIRGYAFLEGWAKVKGHVSRDANSYSPEYVAFRDQWLNEVIDQERQSCG